MRWRILSLVAFSALALIGCGKDFQTTPGGGDAGPSGTGADAVRQSSVPTNGLALWLAADKGVTQASGRATIWEDQSGNHMDAVQSASNAQPKPASFTRRSSSTGKKRSCACRADQLHYEVYNSSHTGGDSPPGVAQEMAVVHRPDQTVELRRNGTIADSDTFELPVVNPRDSTFVGKTLYSACVLHQGLIGETLVYERAVTDREVLGIESYLRGRWSCCSE